MGILSPMFGDILAIDTDDEVTSDPDTIGSQEIRDQVRGRLR